MNRLDLRRFQQSDAIAVSQLFREVYGDHYARPDVYLPNMISEHNADGRWQSMLAVDDGRVLGHAALCHHTPSNTAELALMLVHPTAQGRSIATMLGRRLLEQSQSSKLASLSIKQVTHHLYTQRMAEKIGFHNTGILPDYAPSPFTEPLQETMVLGCYLAEGQVRPLPDITWPESCRLFMQHMSSVFGSHTDTPPCPSMPLQIMHTYKRVEIVVQHLNKILLDQIWHLPRHWLISAKLELSRRFTEDFRLMSALGFAFTGLMPTQHNNGWFALFHRGVQPRMLNLNCVYMQQLHDDLQQNAKAHSHTRALNNARSLA